MAKKGKARVQNTVVSTAQDDQPIERIGDENVETNLSHSLSSELPSSNRSTNEVGSSLSSPSKRFKKVHSTKKMNVRGKAKGVKSGEGIEVEIYDCRIITPKAVSEIHVLFHQKINGPWISYSQYPKSELDTLFARYLAVGFSHVQSEEEVKQAFENSVKCRYSDWMLRIRQPIFNKHKTREDRYKHPPSFIPVNVWKEMVDKWMGENWQHKSDKNKVNRSQSEIIHTTGRVSMAKHRSEMVKQTGKELGPIDCFKKFHTKKDGQTWPAEKAKNIYDQMDSIRSTTTSEGSVVNEWEIYRDVTGVPSHGRVLGLGTGIKGKDVYGNSSSQTCSKMCQESQKRKEEEWEKRFKQMESTITEMRQQVPHMVQAMLQSLGLPNAPPPTQGSDNEGRDVRVNLQENVGNEHEDTNESDENENSLEGDSERGDDDDDDDDDD